MMGLLDLFVHKAIRRLRGADARAPAQRHAAPAEAAVDQHSLAHDDGRRRRDDMAMQPRGRDGVEVRGIGEERKQFLRQQRQPELGLEVTDFQRS
jgi:hypothetical protein